MHRAAHPGSSTDVFTDTVQSTLDTYRLFFLHFTEFLARFHAPNPAKGIYSPPALKNYRDPAWRG